MTDCRGRLLGIDCSEAAQAERRRQLAALLGKLRTGVSSLADRGRSVSYQSPDVLRRLARELRDEIVACDLGFWRGSRRLSVVPYNKGL